MLLYVIVVSLFSLQSPRRWLLDKKNFKKTLHLCALLFSFPPLLHAFCNISTTARIKKKCCEAFLAIQDDAQGWVCMCVTTFQNESLLWTQGNLENREEVGGDGEGAPPSVALSWHPGKHVLELQLKVCLRSRLDPLRLHVLSCDKMFFLTTWMLRLKRAQGRSKHSRDPCKSPHSAHPPLKLLFFFFHFF